MEKMVSNIQKQFHFCVVAVILIAVLSADSVDSRTIEMENYNEIMIPEAIVRCRATCIDRFLFGMENMLIAPNCRGHNNCAMCWDFCQTLFVVDRPIIKSICTNYTCVCFKFNTLIHFYSLNCNCYFF